MKTFKWGTILLAGAILSFLRVPVGSAQEGRADSIAKQQEEKSKKLLPELPDRAEQFLNRMSKNGWFLSPNPRGLYPFFDSVYSGGGLTFGAGYRKFYGDYSFAEVRGLYSTKNYKRFEFRTVSMDHAGGQLDVDVTGGWMDATQIPYYGLGIDSPKEGESNFRLEQTYARAGATWKPGRWIRIRAESGYERFLEKDGTGLSPPIGELYGPETAPTFGVDPSYVHTELSGGIVTAPAEGYARTGSIYRFSFHDYRNVAGNLDSFQLGRAEAVQHIPFLRETWVLSLRGRLDSVFGEAEVPYYLLPWLGSGSTLRGYGTGRFRDRHALLFSGEWRWFPNRFAMDMALFGDVGTVGPHFTSLDFGNLKYDYGIGVRFHGPAVTALRIDAARGNEGWHLVFSASAPF